jgi:hypothetical protein
MKTYTDDEWVALERECLPFAFEGEPKRPARWLQRQVYEDLMLELRASMDDAHTKHPDDIWRPFQILARTEKLIDAYVRQGFDELIPLQEQIRRRLNTPKSPKLSDTLLGSSCAAALKVALRPACRVKGGAA